jgi:hypothetical protein
MMVPDIPAECPDDRPSRRYLIHERDAKFCEWFRPTLMAGGVGPLKLPPRSPILNALPGLGAIG